MHMLQGSLRSQRSFLWRHGTQAGARRRAAGGTDASMMIRAKPNASRSGVDGFECGPVGFRTCAWVCVYP